jgi:hypothetical protein
MLSPTYESRIDIINATKVVDETDMSTYLSSSVGFSSYYQSSTNIINATVTVATETITGITESTITDTSNAMVVETTATEATTTSFETGARSSLLHLRVVIYIKLVSVKSILNVKFYY